jgi:acyl phosphate:glycerol-3-phosphate acyltransferase
MIDLTLFLYLAASYLVGAIPFGLVLSQVFAKKDIRKHGSKNIGATNVARVVGKKLGFATLILDGFKGAIMVLLAQNLFEYSSNLDIVLISVAASAILGHVFPIYLQFKGGKGVATTLATLLALNLNLGFLVCCVWITIFLISRISSIASLSAIFSAIVISYFLGLSDSQIVFSILLFLLVLFRHKENILRLIDGKEKKI